MQRFPALVLHRGTTGVNLPRQVRVDRMLFFRTRRARRLMFIGTLIVLLASLTVAGLFALSLSAVRPAHLGVRNGRLASCPDSPNCVSTQASDQPHWIKPLTLQGDPDGAMERLVAILQSMPSAHIVTRDDHYLHAEFRSRFFRFVDDVEFLIEPETGMVHFRSAARVGYSDLGVNRKRMEEIRRRFRQGSRHGQHDRPVMPRSQ